MVQGQLRSRFLKERRQAGEECATGRCGRRAGEAGESCAGLGRAVKISGGSDQAA